MGKLSAIRCIYKHSAVPSSTFDATTWRKCGCVSVCRCCCFLYAMLACLHNIEIFQEINLCRLCVFVVVWFCSTYTYTHTYMYYVMMALRTAAIFSLCWLDCGLYALFMWICSVDSFTTQHTHTQTHACSRETKHFDNIMQADTSHAYFENVVLKGVSRAALSYTQQVRR